MIEALHDTSFRPCQKPMKEPSNSKWPLAADFSCILGIGLVIQVGDADSQLLDFPILIFL